MYLLLGKKEPAERLSLGKLNPARLSRAALGQCFEKPLENINGYFLRRFSCLVTAPLRGNGSALLGGDFCPIFGADDTALLAQGNKAKAYKRAAEGLTVFHSPRLKDVPQKYRIKDRLSYSKGKKGRIGVENS